MTRDVRIYSDKVYSSVYKVKNLSIITLLDNNILTPLVPPLFVGCRSLVSLRVPRSLHLLRKGSSEAKTERTRGDGKWNELGTER